MNASGNSFWFFFRKWSFDFKIPIHNIFQISDKWQFLNNKMFFELFPLSFKFIKALFLQLVF